MMHATTPTRPERLRSRRNAYARSGLVLAVVFGLAACGPAGPVQPPVVPGDLTLTGIAPTQGNQNTVVTVTGTNIAQGATVTVGDQAATNVLVNQPGTQVQFNPPVLAAGTYDVTVTQDDESATLEDAFTFVPPTNGDPGTPGAAVARLNAAPAAVGGVTIDGVEWAHDAPFVVNVGQTGTFQTAQAISGTDADILYQTERHALGGGTLEYQIPVEAGDYQVVLHFAEIFYGLPGGGQAGGAGSRVFNIVIEGATVATNYDVFVAAGGPATAVTSTHDVTVTDGTLNIALVSQQDNAKISAIEVFVLDEGNGEGTTEE